MDITDKQLGMVEETIYQIVARQRKFTECVEKADIIGMIDVFTEECCEHMMMLPDMVDNPEAKTKLTDTFLNAVSESKMNIAKARAVQKAVDDFVNGCGN